MPEVRFVEKKTEEFEKLAISVLNEVTDCKQDFINKFKAEFTGVRNIPHKYKIIFKDSSAPVINSGRGWRQSARWTIWKASKVEYPTDWVNNIDIVEKPNGSIRICLDPNHVAVKKD